MKEITIVVPSMNERDAIQRLIGSIPVSRLEEIGYKTTILVVDSSADDTPELAAKAGAKVVRELRMGYGRAYKTGFENAEGDIIATVDADMTYPVEEIPVLVRLLEEENVDFINTNRYGYMENGAMPITHRIGNTILNKTTKFLFRSNLCDSQSGMWVFRKDLLKKATLRSDSMAFSEELKIEALYFLKARWKEVPIQYRVRVGKPKIRTWKHGMENLLFLFSKRIKR
jgi:dolichol-phosphate hexosyltransferase